MKPRIFSRGLAACAAVAAIFSLQSAYAGDPVPVMGTEDIIARFPKNSARRTQLKAIAQDFAAARNANDRDAALDRLSRLCADCTMEVGGTGNSRYVKIAIDKSDSGYELDSELPPPGRINTGAGCPTGQTRDNGRCVDR